MACGREMSVLSHVLELEAQVALHRQHAAAVDAARHHDVLAAVVALASPLHAPLRALRVLGGKLRSEDELIGNEELERRLAHLKAGRGEVGQPCILNVQLF